MSEKQQLTLKDKWASDHNAVTVKKTVQNRLKKQFGKNAVDKKRGGNKGE